MTRPDLHILLVDDDDIDVMTVQRAFTRSQISHPLHVAHNGLQGLEKLRDGSIASARRLVLLDLNMPRMNGIEFLRELRTDPELRTTSVVVLTTSDEARDKTEAYELGVAGYLLKPVSFAELVDLVAAVDRYWNLVEMP